MKLRSSLVVWCLCLASGLGFYGAPSLSFAVEPEQTTPPTDRSVSQVKGPSTQALSLEGVENIELRGLAGTVRLTGATAAEAEGSRLFVRTSGGASADGMNGLKVQRKGARLILSFTEDVSKSDWRGGRIQDETVTVEMAGVKVPLEIFWHRGSVSATKMSAPLAVNLVSGRVGLSVNQADVRVQLQEGDLEVKNHQGRLDLDIYKGKVVVDQVQGRLNLSHFAGSSQVQNVEGDIELFSFSGTTEVSNTVGRIQFENGRGEINFRSHNGALHGQSDQGPILTQVSGENVDVDIRTRLASASVVLHQGLAPRVYLRSREGSVHGPRGLSYKNTSVGKVLTGSLGAGGDGRVRILSDSGALRLR